MVPTRHSMAWLITKTRLLIGDPLSQQFQDQDIQDQLDMRRNDVRYEPLILAASIVNIGGTANVAETIYADYYSKFRNWEDNVTIQAIVNGKPWVVATPLASDLIVGRWQFELDVFTTATVPGQIPPVFATGFTYDLYGSAADLLQLWAATLTSGYDITVDGQSLHRSQLMQQKLTLANIYLKQARARTAKMVRPDIQAGAVGRGVRLLDSPDDVQEVR